MALNSSGEISLIGSITGQSIAKELTLSETAELGLFTPSVRTLLSVASGEISMYNGYGKSSGPSAWSATISSNQTNLDLYTYATGAGYPGSGAANITIAPGVYIYATSTGNAGLTIPASFGAGNLTLINNGYIHGKGGLGASVFGVSGSAGGPGMSISTPIILTNNSYIAGGGGGGGSADNGSGGGGGAGGGDGGVFPGSPAGNGGVTGNPGGNGPAWSAPAGGGGGGGGSVFPGTGGAGGGATFPPVNNGTAGFGGGAGGGGTGSTRRINPLPTTQGAGGGGGWGAAGGAGKRSPFYPFTITAGAGGSGNAVGGSATGGPGTWPTSYPGGAGGNAINLNGNSITYPASGTIWGAVS
jgi:hypothetical protein